jgi:hypothetical protein
MHTTRFKAIAVASTECTTLPDEPDSVSIRGVRLPLAELVDRSLMSPERQATLRAQLLEAKPFPHLTLDNLFHPRLLELVLEEFDTPEWRNARSAYESTRRSVLAPRLGPASQLYFDITNSGWFTLWLSAVTGIGYLLPDPKLLGGGLHESRDGATFAVHRDFNRHCYNGLKNEMVLITYLNKGWDPAWGASLELWDQDLQRCVTHVVPEFGRTILLPHGPKSYHGHPQPVQTPDGRPRRSIAAYYYTSPDAGRWRDDQVVSRFLYTRRIDQAKWAMRMMVPPALWSAVRMLFKR